MGATLQIVDGLGGPLIVDLNADNALLGRGDLKLADTVIGDTPRTRWVATSEPVALDTRTITIPVLMRGDTPADLADQVALVSRATSRPWWLRVRRHLSLTDSWLRCWPTVPQISTNVSGVHSATVAAGSITAQCDPYAYGPRVTTSSLQAKQDPAAAGGGLYFDINGVTGDALTPLVLRCNDSKIVLNGQTMTLVSIRRRGKPANLTPFWLQGESGSPTPGSPVTAAVISDVSQSGGQAARFTWPAATPAYTGYGLVWWQQPPLSGLEWPGTYRLVARVTRRTGMVGVPIRFTVNVGPYEPRTYVMGSDVNDVSVIDLGLVPVPLLSPPQMGAPLAPFSVSAGDLSIKVERTTDGSGVVDVDWVALIPADEDTGILQVGDPDGWVVLDGYSGAAYPMSADPIANPAATITSPLVGSSVAWYGGVPRLAPGDNRIYFVGGLGNAAPWAQSGTVTCWGTYWPRYSWLR